MIGPANPVGRAPKQGKGPMPDVLSDTQLQNRDHGVRTRRLAGGVGLAVVAWLSLSYWVSVLYADHREDQLRAQASVVAASSVSSLANALNQRLALVRGVAAFVSVKAGKADAAGLDTEFPTFAAAIATQVPGIRNISVAPDFGVGLVYPNDPGNLSVIGNNILNDRRPGFAAAVRRAIDSRSLTIHEPVELIQGGLGFLARQAVFVDERPWGAVGMAFTVKALLADSRIGALEGYVWGLRTAIGTPVAGDQAAFLQAPVLAAVDLPDGHWDFALAPVGGWRAQARSSKEMVALLVLMGLAGILGGWLLWDTMRQRGRLEHLVESRTAALTEANAEMERFAFVAAHDLQEPLRAIITYSQLVERAVGDRLDDQQRGWLGELMGSARRMRGLLHDTQIFLGEVAIPLPRAPIPAGEALAVAQRKLSDQIRESGAKIDIGPMPDVWADPHRLTEIFSALLSNAIEYRSPDRPCHVSVTAQRVGDYDIIDVADNGMGIDPAYFDRIFEVFQRLHARAGYAGTGMGLAIVRKMLNRLGGMVKVRSQAGAGSTFSVYLPVRGRKE